MFNFLLKNFLLLVLFISLTSMRSHKSHPFHVSVTDLSYNMTSQTYQVSCKLFVNDFEDVLALRYNTFLDVFKEINEEKSIPIYTVYLDKHLAIFGNQMPVKLNIIGAEIEDTAIWIYAESATMPKPKEVYVKNTFLCDFFNDQINIVNIKIGDKKQMKRLICGENEWRTYF